MSSLEGGTHVQFPGRLGGDSLGLLHGKEEGDGESSSSSNLSGLYSVAVTCLSGTNIGESSHDITSASYLPLHYISFCKYHSFFSPAHVTLHLLGPNSIPPYPYYSPQCIGRGRERCSSSQRAQWMAVRCRTDVTRWSHSRSWISY